MSWEHLLTYFRPLSNIFPLFFHGNLELPEFLARAAFSDFDRNIFFSPGRKSRVSAIKNFKMVRARYSIRLHIYQVSKGWFVDEWGFGKVKVVSQYNYRLFFQRHKYSNHVRLFSMLKYGRNPQVSRCLASFIFRSDSRRPSRMWSQPPERGPRPSSSDCSSHLRISRSKSCNPVSVGKTSGTLPRWRTCPILRCRSCWTLCSLRNTLQYEYKHNNYRAIS